MEHFTTFLENLDTLDLFIMTLMGLVFVGIVIYINNDDQRWW